MHFRDGKDNVSVPMVLGMAFMQTMLFLEKLTTPINFYKNYHVYTV